LKQAATLHERTIKPPGQKEPHETLLEVNEVADRLSLSAEVRKRALAICLEVRGSPVGHGIPHRVLIAAALYVACREKKIPITLRDLAEASGSHHRDVGRCYLQILEGMHISRPQLNGKGYVYRISLRRPVPVQAMKMAQGIINRMSARGLGGRNPMTIAAASLYLACCSMGENVTQAEVAEAAGVGEESVRECCKEIRTLMTPAPA
jgi:transcription initiation factor TFIIB